MSLLDLLAWAVVELDGSRPKTGEVKRALELALQSAAHLDLKHKVRTHALLRLAQVTGTDNGGTKWNL